MSLTWRILLVSLLLNLLTVGVVQVVVYLSQEDWFRRERNNLLEPVLDSLSLLERIYVPEALSSPRQVRPLVLSPEIREVYEDVIVTSGRPGYENLIYLNPRGAVHRDPDRFPRAAILAGMERSATQTGMLPVAGGYCYCLRQGSEIAGYLWFVPRHPESSPTAPLLWAAFGAILVSTALFGLLLVFFVRRTVTLPLQKIGSAAEQVAAGRYEVRLPASERLGELGPVVATFNRMASQVQGHTALLQSEVRAAVEEQKQKERALVLSARLASIGTLAAGVAHEINNPIGGMQNAVNRLLQGENLGERQRTYLELVQSGLARIARTARRLLDFSPRAVAAGNFPIGKAIDSALALVEHRVQQSGVTLRVDVAPDLPAVAGDAHEIQQVVLNLLLNALDALESKGRGGSIAVRAWAGDGKLLIECEDDGPGMDPRDLGHVFDPFFSKKERPDASGLGLFICYSIVHNHGGTIGVDSRPGAGFRVHIELPAAGAP